MAVPYTFGSATASIPLSQLDSNFATTITMGNTAVQLCNTVTTLNNMTLGNVTVSSGNVVAGIASGTITQAMLGTNVAGNGPAFSAYVSANQSVSSGVNTKVALNAEFFDTASCFDSTTNYRFTPNVAGYYQLNLPLLAYSSSSQITAAGVLLYKNGTQITYQQTNMSATVIASACLSTVVYANGTTDYFEMYASVTGTNVFVSGGTGTNVTTTFSGSLVRAA